MRAFVAIGSVAMGLALWVGLLAFCIGVFVGFRLRALAALYEIQIVVERKNSAVQPGPDGGPVRSWSLRGHRVHAVLGHQEPPEEGQAHSQATRGATRLSLACSDHATRSGSLLDVTDLDAGWLEVEKLKGQYTKLWMVLGNGWLLSYKTENVP